MKSTLTPARRRRLETLAAHLESLPADYAQFNMRLYYSGSDESRYARHNGGLRCGTVACALGHGPAAGILFPPRMLESGPNWNEYANLFTGDGWTGLNYDWLFYDSWDDVDPSHYGAAARIRYLLDKGRPPKGFGRPGIEWREVYAPYRIDAKAQADA